MTEPERIVVLEGKVKVLSSIVGDMGVGLGRQQAQLASMTRVLKELVGRLGRLEQKGRYGSPRLVSHISPGMRGR